MSKELENLIKHTVTRKAIIKTGPRLLFLLRVNDWLKSGLPGAIVVAGMRFGKTYGTRWVLTTLGVPYIIIPTRSRTKPSEGGFFSHILTSVRHRYANKGTVDTRRDRVTNYLVALAQKSATNTIIVAFDEAHKLLDIQYQWILELQNELELRGVTVFYLLVGQQRLEDVRVRLELSGQTEITARFMMDIWRLPGIASVEEVEECFSQYDEIQLEGKSLTEFCVPESSETGWRISMLAHPIWTAFCKVGGGATIEVPMHYLIHALSNALAAIATINDFKGEVPLELADKAVKATLYKPLLAQKYA